MSQLDLLRELAKNGDASAQCQLAAELAQGERLDQDIEASLYWYAASARQGHTDAVWNIGLVLAEGLYGIRKNETLGHRLIMLAARNGHPSAMPYVVRNRGRMDQSGNRMSDKDFAIIQGAMIDDSLDTFWSEFGQELNDLDLAAFAGFQDQSVGS